MHFLWDRTKRYEVHCCHSYMLKFISQPLVLCSLYFFSLDYFWPFLSLALIGILCFLVAFSCIHQPEFAPICIYLVISPQVSLIPLTSPFPLASIRSTYPEKLSAYTVYRGLSTMGFFFQLMIFFAILVIFILKFVLHLRSLLVCLVQSTKPAWTLFASKARLI